MISRSSIRFEHVIGVFGWLYWSIYLTNIIDRYIVVVVVVEQPWSHWHIVVLQFVNDKQLNLVVAPPRSHTLTPPLPLSLSNQANPNHIICNQIICIFMRKQNSSRLLCYGDKYSTLDFIKHVSPDARLSGWNVDLVYVIHDSSQDMTSWRYNNELVIVNFCHNLMNRHSCSERHAWYLWI